jgi:hypothetical protein
MIEQQEAAFPRFWRRFRAVLSPIIVVAWSLVTATVFARTHIDPYGNPDGKRWLVGAVVGAAVSGVALFKRYAK